MLLDSLWIRIRRHKNCSGPAKRYPTASHRHSNAFKAINKRTHRPDEFARYKLTICVLLIIIITSSGLLILFFISFISFSLCSEWWLVAKAHDHRKRIMYKYELFRNASNMREKKIHLYDIEILCTTNNTNSVQCKYIFFCGVSVCTNLVQACSSGCESFFFSFWNYPTFFYVWVVFYANNCNAAPMKCSITT